jgi:ABC-2 type transport system permease protein
VFEAQTLTNAFRFPMIFPGGVFVRVTLLPLGLQIVARVLPLTYAVGVLRAAREGDGSVSTSLHLVVLAGFTAVLLDLAVRLLARPVA